MVMLDQENIDRLQDAIQLDIIKEQERLGQRNSQTAEAQANSETLEQQNDPYAGRRIYSCREFLETDHGNIEPLIGSKDSALLVPGEALLIPGTGGVGKTLFITQMAISAAIAENILGWELPRPLKSIIYQAELPRQFFHKRLDAMIDSYRLGSKPEIVDQIQDNIFIAYYAESLDLADSNGTSIQRIAADVEEYQVDLIFLDPFLSYFDGDENDNSKVRRSLDALKHQVADKHNCGIVLTDHIPKYGNASINPEKHYQARGASAKRDWAASVVALNTTKTPDGQHGSFIKATVDKLRYGKVPSDAITIRRDDLTLRHLLFNETLIDTYQVAQLIDNNGGDLTKNKLVELLGSEFSLSRKKAQKSIKQAVTDSMVEVEKGSNNSIRHKLGKAYIERRDASD